VLDHHRSGLGLHDHHRHVMGDDVVHLARDAVALGDHRCLRLHRAGAFQLLGSRLDLCDPGPAAAGVLAQQPGGGQQEDWSP
jgi:hypothetical protein